MFKFRIKYKNDWHEIKTMVFESDSYQKVLNMAINNFGEHNIIEIVGIDDLSQANKRFHTEDTTMIFDDMG